jgi:O-antigen/teichoic acid export membrane protein
MARRLIKRGYGLVAISSMEIGLPFIRMMLMSRWLSLPELGFASALASAYSLFDQITDIAIYRYVYSEPREHYEEALAAAHALSVTRGVIVGALIFALSPLIAAAFSLQASWMDFAVLSGVIFIRSFEHLESRVAERDYNFGSLAKLTFSANAISFAGLIAGLSLLHDHRALTASLFGLAIGFATVSHLVARTPYRLAFRSPHFRKAFKFGYPLMLNGVGMAVSGQGDRFLVGSLLGLTELGIYSVVMLAIIVPISMVYRIMSSITSAALYNASASAENLRKRVILTTRLTPMIAALYAIGVLCLANIVVPLVFGPQFRVSQFAMSVLALGAFLRIARAEPFNSLLLLAQHTKKIAMGSLSVLGGLVFGLALMYYYRTIEAALIGRALGEALNLGVMLFMTRKLLHGASADYYTSFAMALVLVVSASLFVFLTPVGLALTPSLLALAGYAVVFVLWGVLALLPLLKPAAPTVVAVADRPSS